MKKVYSILTKALILSLVIALPFSFTGQETGKEDAKKENKSSSFSRYLFLQGQFGASFYHGDVAKYAMAPDISNTSINGSLGIGYQLLPWLNVQGNLNRGFARGEKDNIVPKNIPTGDFKTYIDFYGGDLQLGVNLSNLLFGYKERFFSVGIHGGLGQAQWQSWTWNKTTGSNYSAGQKGTKNNGTGKGISDRNVDLTVPGGIDLNFAVSDKLDIFADYTFTWMKTDYADNVKHGAMAFKNDTYSHFNIGGRYKFGSNINKKMAANFEKIDLKATPSPLEEKGGTIEVTIKGTFPPKYFGKKAILCFTPVLKYEGGETAFEPMNFKGEDVAGDGTLVSYANGGSFTYSSTIPYDPAMDVSELVVAPVIYTYTGEVYESCEAAEANGSKVFVAPERKLDDGVIHTSQLLRNTALLAFALDAYEKVTISTQQSELYFRVNRSALNWKLPLNKDEENYDALKTNMADMEKGWLLEDITIDGWASPEGEETFNEGLSERRAQTALKYMEKKIKKAAKKNELIADEGIDFVVTSNGPDWNGFMKAVKSSDIKDKSAILNVINSADQTKKEEEIRNMILIYPEIERDILPPLRRADINVNTFMPKKTDAEIAELSTSNPGSLDIEELFFAATLTEDNGTKKVIYGSIIELYPKCWRSVNNAASVELAEGNYEIAHELLMKGTALNENSFEIQNNMGIYYMMVGDYPKAEQSFYKAQDLGGDENYNLGLVNIALGDYSKAVTFLSGASCDFNLGLAQLLNGNANAAEKTFKCAPQDAETLYLLAITAAHQDNKSSMLNYLGQSIKADPEVAGVAATNREFMKYYNDADFKALVNSK